MKVTADKEDKKDVKDTTTKETTKDAVVAPKEVKDPETIAFDGSFIDICFCLSHF